MVMQMAMDWDDVVSGPGPSTSIMELDLQLPLTVSPCQVCGLPAHGNHFGAISCRACAAFFRRAGTCAKTVYKCKKDNECDIWSNGRYTCKKCRLVKCTEVGMDSTKFQFDRDPISTTEQFCNTKIAKKSVFIEKLPETIEHFLGRPHFIIFIGPSKSMLSDKNFIDCQFLIEKASNLLTLGSAKPLFAKNPLQKLTLGLRLVREHEEGGGTLHEPLLITKIGKDEAMTFWERDFLMAARWLTYYDEFQLLPHAQQILLLKAVWHVWGRMDKLILTAIGRRRNIVKDKMVMIGNNELMDVSNVELDISWFTKYKKEELGYFFDEIEDFMLIHVLEHIVELHPSDIEITYMLCQLCFHYAAKRFQGEIMDVMERFQETLANNLHDYYVNELKMPRYCGRLNQMMKINNMIQQDIWEKRSKYEIAKIFDIYCVEFSHPEMFQDSAC